MAVNVHGVSGLVLVIHDNANCSIAAEVVDVPFRLPRVLLIPLVCKKQKRIVVICTLCLVVHDPDMVTRCVCE